MTKHGVLSKQKQKTKKKTLTGFYKGTLCHGCKWRFAMNKKFKVFNSVSMAVFEKLGLACSQKTQSNAGNLRHAQVCHGGGAVCNRELP